MDFGFTEDQEALREIARKILSELVTHERLKQVEAGDDGIDRELWSQLARANLLGIAVPEEYGGSGLGFLELCLLLAELGRAVAPIPAWPTLVLGALPVLRFGTDAQREALLPGVADGSVMLSAALHEGGPAEPLAPTTAARSERGGWRLHGTKDCVPAAHAATRILVPARDDEGRIALFLLDPQAPGVELHRQATTSREPMARVWLHGAHLAETDRLGDPARGAEMLGWLTGHAAAAVCAIQSGVSERALEITAAYVRERQQFGRPIGSFQAVHQRAADAYIQVEAIRLSAWQAAWRLAEGLPADEELAIAKYWASAGGASVAFAAQHLHGGIGVDADYPLHRYYLWTKQLALTLGGAGAQLERVGECLAEPRP